MRVVMIRPVTAVLSDYGLNPEYTKGGPLRTPLGILLANLC